MQVTGWRQHRGFEMQNFSCQLSAVIVMQSKD